MMIMTATENQRQPGHPHAQQRIAIDWPQLSKDLNVFPYLPLSTDRG